MKYRYANRAEQNEEARKREALDADIRAFATWIEAQVNEVDDPEGAAKKLRTYADKRLVEESCSQADVRSSRQQWLENWIRRLEESHADVEARAEIREEHAEDASVLHREMQRLEKSHAFATEQLDKLLNETPREERRRRTRATKTTAPVAKSNGRVTSKK